MTSRERVRVARALVELPKVDAALAAGEMSYSKARAITRVATPATEPILVQYAELCTASQLETICRKLHAVGRLEANPTGIVAHQDDRYVASSTAAGMVCVKALLRPDEAALLMQVIQKAAVDCGREATEDNGPPADASAEDPAAASSVSPSSSAPLDRTPSRSCDRADGLMAVLHAYARGSSPLRPPFELIVTTPAEVPGWSSPATLGRRR